MIAAIAFVFGLLIGSFLNVCILRLPRGLSIVLPASHCPHCKTPIRPYDNIPVLSWLLLGGKCRACHAPISAQYPLVELASGLLCAASVAAFGASLLAAKWVVLFSLLLVHVVTDWRERFLSFSLNMFGLAAGLLFGVLAPDDLAATSWLFRRLTAGDAPAWSAGLLAALGGAALGAGLLWVVAEGYFRLTKRQGMGLGDVYLMAMVGSFLGMERTLLTILAGSLLGSVLGLAWITALFAGGWKSTVAKRAQRRGLGKALSLRLELARRFPLPFGTYLGLAAVGVVFWGAPALRWYADWKGLGT